jgi:hypothetical protein
MRNFECGQHKPPDSTTRLQHDCKRTTNRLESVYHRCRIHVLSEKIGSTKRHVKVIGKEGKLLAAALRRRRSSKGHVTKGEVWTCMDVSRGYCCNEGKVAGGHLLYIVYRKARTVAEYQYTNSGACLLRRPTNHTKSISSPILWISITSRKISVWTRL